MSLRQAVQHPVVCLGRSGPSIYASVRGRRQRHFYDAVMSSHTEAEQYLKTKALRREHLDEFVEIYRPGKPRSSRAESVRFRPFTYDELVARDKANLDIIWLRDDSLEDAADLPAPEVVAQVMMDELEAALAEIAAIVQALAPDGA